MINKLMEIIPSAFVIYWDAANNSNGSLVIAKKTTVVSCVILSLPKDLT